MLLNIQRAFDAKRLKFFFDRELCSCGLRNDFDEDDDGREYFSKKSGKAINFQKSKVSCFKNNEFQKS